MMAIRWIAQLFTFYELVFTFHMPGLPDWLPEL